MMSWMVGSGSSVRGAPRATNSLGSASRAQLLPSPPTATTSSLGPREPITGRVSHCFRGGEKGTKLSSYLREGISGSTWPSMPTYSLPYNPVALQHCPPMSCQHTHEWRYLLSFTWLCSSTPWHEPPHARLVLPINTAAHTSSLPFPSLHAAAG